MVLTRYLYTDGVFANPLTNGDKEEEKGAGGFDDDKSSASRATDKTNKTGRGKALDKHCPLCDFKLVPGPHWARHCKNFHPSAKIEVVKCGLACTHCKGKYMTLIAHRSPPTGKLTAHH